MNKKELETLLSPNETDKVYIPNEIFDDLHQCEGISTTSQMTFTYTYYCLISYLFRYCKYDQGDFKPGDIKQIIGRSKTNKILDKIIKKGGVLDQLGYTESIRDFPVKAELDQYKDIEFVMYSDLDDEIRNYINLAKNFKIKYPVKGFYRTQESEEEKVCDGTFFEIENTHLFNINVCIEMLGSDIGDIGFYIYQFFSNKNDLYGDYDISFEKFTAETGISNFTFNNYVHKLENAGYMEVTRQPFDRNLSIEERKSNTYKVLR